MVQFYIDNYDDFFCELKFLELLFGELYLEE